MRLRAWGMIGIAGSAGLGLAAWGFLARHAPATRPAGPVARAVGIGPETPISALTKGVAGGDGRSLIALRERFDAGPGDLSDWLTVPAALRSGFGGFGGAGKTKSLELSGAIFDRFGKSEPPIDWAMVLVPTRGLLTAGLSDPDPAIRSAALEQVRSLWTWAPDRSILPVEEDDLAAWKTGLHADVVRRIGDASPAVRASVASCLSALPLDDKAAPALALAKDSDPIVRSKVLLGFAARPDLLTVEEILPMLHDRSEIANVAAIVLKTRGLTVDQIQLAKMLASPKAEVRVASIPEILARGEIDPSIWLVFLSRDADPEVRTRAVAALEGRVTPDARRRLQEIAASDPVVPIRDAARKLLSVDEATASLPPLPGSPSLNPRAN